MDNGGLSAHVQHRRGVGVIDGERTLTRPVLTMRQTGIVCWFQIIFAVGSICSTRVEGQPPRLSLREIFRVGSGKPGPDHFGLLSYAISLEGGSVAALFTDSERRRKLQIFDTTGKPGWSYSFKTGDVPDGIAANAMTVSILVLDDDSKTIVTLDVARQTAVSRKQVPTQGDIVELLPSLSGVPVIHTVRMFEREGTGLLPLALPVHQLHAVGSDGAVRLALAFSDSSPRVTYQRPIVPLSLSPPWFARPVVAVANGLAYYNNGSEYRIRVSGANRQDTREIRIDASPVAVDSADYVRWFTEWANLAPNRDLSIEIKDRVRALSFDKRRAPIGKILVAPSGELAIVRRDLAASPVTGSDSVVIDIVESDGRVRGQAALRAGTRVQAFREGHILVIETDPSVPSGIVVEGRMRPLSQLVLYRVTS